MIPSAVWLVSIACKMPTVVECLFSVILIFHTSSEKSGRCFILNGLVRQDNPPALGRNDRFDMLPTVGQFEHYTVPYASIPSANSPLVAVKVLGFRLKGGGSGKSRTSGGYSQRPSSGTSGMYALQVSVSQANQELMQCGFLLLRWNRQSTMENTFIFIRMCAYP